MPSLHQGVVLFTAPVLLQGMHRKELFFNAKKFNSSALKYHKLRHKYGVAAGESGQRQFSLLPAGQSAHSPASQPSRHREPRNPHKSGGAKPTRAMK
jgi:hypothetical protein